MHRERMSALRTVIERAQARGELPAKRDVQEMIAGVVGPLFYRRWFSREPLTDRFVTRVVERAIGEPKSKS